MTKLQEQLLQYIAFHLDRELLLGVEDSVRSAYKAAHEDTERRIKHTPKSRYRSQVRRYLIDDALAALSSRFESKIIATEPRGEHYILLCSGNITLSHIELHASSKPRLAKHRKLMSLKNAVLEPQNYDFWMQPPPDLEDSLHVVATVIHPNPKDNEQHQPALLSLTVPYTDWSSNHLDVPLQEIYPFFQMGEESNQVDTAWPSLKIALRKAEGLD
ncbi:hypothetical protein [Marinobacter sp. AC-23]|uniref:hypothetical protein n=1 Tax=Marinobacter sp. AC-23 TaxID=1879031 RepID=UPI0008DE011F|nr:hypothetical protein [Marinobacter sp. AC-23]OHY78742.1 hypothetical protein BCA33_17570 [Marinobacter sp. AC-23]